MHSATHVLTVNGHSTRHQHRAEANIDRIALESPHVPQQHLPGTLGQSPIRLILVYPSRIVEPIPVRFGPTGLQIGLGQCRLFSRVHYSLLDFTNVINVPSRVP